MCFTDFLTVCAVHRGGSSVELDAISHFECSRSELSFDGISVHFKDSVVNTFFPVAQNITALIGILPTSFNIFVALFETSRSCFRSTSGREVELATLHTRPLPNRFLELFALRKPCLA